MPLLLFLLFIVLPIAELYVIIQVGQAIGIWWTLLLLIADSILGTALMRAQGRAAWLRFNAAIAERRVPAREVADGALIVLGGAFLLAPGFITDVVGILLLLPPSRAVVRRGVMRGALGRFFLMVPGMGARGPERGRDYDVDSTARDVDSDPRRLP